MPTNRAKLGTRGEGLARRLLEQKGYLIVDNNFRCSWGEIDLVAQDGDEIVFVEVRTRRGSRFGTPEESITEAKAHHMVAAAQEYLQQRESEAADWRLDLVAIVLTPTGKVDRIDHLQNVVEL